MALLHFAPSQMNAIQMNRHKRFEAEKPKSKQNAAQAVWKLIWNIAISFGKRTTIHGVNRLFGEAAGVYERVFWLLTVVAAFVGSIYVCLIVSNKFTEGKFQTVVDSTRMPVYKIVFPVITICNANRLNWMRIEEAKRKFLPNESSIEKLKLFERIVGAYDDIRFANFEIFNVLQNERVDLLKAVNFSLVVDFMTWRCEELLTNCRWRQKKYNCCEIFFKRRSQHGFCWAFNTLESAEGLRMQRLDPLYPWRTGGAGPRSALEVKIEIHPENHFPNRSNDKGAIVMVTEPTVWHRDPLGIPENTRSLVEIEPVIYFHDNDTRSIPSDQRECVFNTETSSSDFKSLLNFVYMIENCQSECHQEYLMRYCNCTMDLLFPPGQYPSCKATDLLCLAHNNDHFTISHQPGEEKYVKNDHDGMICKCFRNCYSLNYIPDVRSSYLPPNVRDNKSIVDLDVHFRFETLMTYRTSLVFGWVDLMVAFGGIAGLFLGCSLISAMEIVYLALIEVPNFILKQTKCCSRQHPQPAGPEDANQIQHLNQHKFSSRAKQNNVTNGRHQFKQFVIRNNANNQNPLTIQPEKATDWHRLLTKAGKNPFNHDITSHY